MENQDTIFSDLDENFEEATYIQRFLASAIDTVITIGGIVLFMKLMPDEIVYNFFGTGKIKIYIFIFLVIIVYRVVCLLVFDKTIGMMIIKIKYLKEARYPLSSREKIIISLASLTKKFRLYKDEQTIK